MKQILTVSVFLIISLVNSTISIQAGDRFEETKDTLSAAALIHFDIAMAVVSDIFPETDSSEGSVYIAADGRYVARFESDIYLFDGRCIWEYSDENKQATRRCLKEGQEFEYRLFFIKDFDRYFESRQLKSGHNYLLIKKDRAEKDLPDTIQVILEKSAPRIRSMEYRDLNGDLNRIYFRSQETSSIIDSSLFKIDLPDSVEVIRLP